MKTSVIVISSAALVAGFSLGLIVPRGGSDVRSEGSGVSAADRSETGSIVRGRAATEFTSKSSADEVRLGGGQVDRPPQGVGERKLGSQSAPSSPATEPLLEHQPTVDPDMQQRLAEENWAAADELEGAAGEVPAEIAKNTRGMADFAATSDQAGEAERWGQFKENAPVEELARDAVESLSAAGAPTEMIRHTEQLLLSPRGEEPEVPIDPRELAKSPRG